MKFGRNLPRNVVPEWSSSYINYKALKKLIKSAAEDLKAGKRPDLAGFFYSLDRNLEDVDHFYNKKLADFTRRLKLLEDRFGHALATGQQLEGEDIDDLLTALLELRGQLRKLQWYGEVNRRGFIKITKKLDKRVPGADAQKRYLTTKVDPAPFATNTQLSKALAKINEWLSHLGDRNEDDASSTKSSTLSLKRVASRPTLNLPQSLLSALDQALATDDAPVLLELLGTVKIAADEQGEDVYQKVLKSILQRAVLARARAVINAILGKIDSLDEEDDINKRNCIHRLVISIGRSQSTADSESSGNSLLEFPGDTNYITPATAPSMQTARPVLKEANQSQPLTRDHPAISLLQYLLDHLRPHQRNALLAKDLVGRTPLHYGAQYGFRVVCEIIIEHLQQWDMFDVSEGIDGKNWQDSEGWAPLHLSVVGGHPLTTKALLAAENWKNDSKDTGAVRKNASKSGAVLALAVKANFVDIVQLLVDAGVDINYQDEEGETALHVAARFNHEECARILLDGSAHQKANTEIAEHTYSWTPLFTACVDGSLRVVELLIAAGADLERADSSGWTAKEHAALRGHLDIARRLAEVTPAPEATEPEVTIPVPPPAASSPSSPPQSSLAERKSNGMNGSSGHRVPPEPIKTFGHRYLTDESMILVNLGSMDIRKSEPAVSLDRIPIKSAHSTQLDTALSIVVSANGARGEPEVIDLPIQDSMATEPITFFANDATKVKLLFDLVPTYAGSKDQVVGRAVALLSSIKPSLGSNRISLQGDVRVPIIAANTLEVIGTLTFNFLVITPFHHPKMSVKGDQTYWKTIAAPMVIGHRGLGKNFASRKSLQLGENTVQSFIAAANLGASYVEFDVQLTKDHVPVIYHDFLVSETGIDAPVHTLTLEQFLHVGNTGSHSPRQDSSHKIENAARSAGTRQRSMSVGGSEFDPKELSERMKHTRDFKTKGFKGNTRGNHIQAPFATLEELFKKLPKSVGFNIELKYPMLNESEDQEMDTYAVEINSFVDTVLNKVYDLGEGRNMIFSSFNPDICLLLSFKQPSIPVLFLTDAGTSPVSDIRASSLQEAIRFASRWNLLGIVSTSEPFVLCPRLVRVVKESGLVCVSYGTLNNDPENVKLQVAKGIDAVIVDSVLAIRRGLTEGSGNLTPKPSPQPSPLAEAQAVPNGNGVKATADIPVSSLESTNGQETTTTAVEEQAVPNGNGVKATADIPVSLESTNKQEATTTTTTKVVN